jgi:RimJ/RimL family protein N-acetyltransferase
MAVIITARQTELALWFSRATGSEPTTDATVYIGLERDGAICAVVAFDGYKKRSICMHVAATGKKWMTKEYLRYCFHYPFEVAGVDKIIGLVDSTNADAMRFDLHLGFEVEAVIKGAGEFGDINILTMTRAQCRFLDIKRATPDDADNERKHHG